MAEVEGSRVLDLVVIDGSAPIQPIVLYAVRREKGMDEDQVTEGLNRTQEATHDLMVDPRWQGKTVVMVWEHKHIANQKL
jgi:hypothetical protein